MKWKSLLCALLVSAAPAFAQSPAAADSGGELMQPKSSMAGNGAEKYRLISQRDEIVSVLHNNMTVIVKRVPTPVVAVRGLVGTGGVYEGKWLGGGLSHLLEHLVAGGSSERRSEAENRNLLQQIGNDSNAYTTEDNTCFFVNTTTPHLGQAVDLVTGWLLGAKITPNEYRREYQVVQRELEMGKGEPDRQFYYMEAMNRYRQSPARVPVIGYQEVIQGLSRDDVFSYYKLAYEPSNMIFVVVGDVDPEQMLATVRKNVADTPPGRVFSHNIEQEPPVDTPRTLVATFPKLGQARLELGFPSVKLSSDDLYPLDLLATILGSGESSILVQQLRDQQQLVSGISANDDTPTYVSGTFAVDMQLDAAQVAAATKAVMAVLDDVKHHPIDADRIARAKAQMKVGRVSSLQTAETIAASLADDFYHTGDPHFSDKYIDRIETVTAADLQRVANQYLNPQQLITTLLLPAEAPGSEGLAKATDLIRPATPAAATAATAAPLASASAVQRVELPSGVILLLKRITTTPLVVMHMYSLGGVSDEDAANNGIGNLAMDLVQRGTTTRSAQQIAEFFDSVGGSLSCECGNNSWYWTASCLKEDFAKTFDVYADVVNHPSFPDSEVAEMKQRVDAAIGSEDADWTSQAFRFFKKQFFGPEHSPYQYTALGTQQNVDHFSPQQLRDWYQQKILASRRVLAIYGDVDLQQAKQLAEKAFGGGPRADSAAASAASAASAEPATQSADAGGDVPSVKVDEVQIQPTQQALAGIVIGFKSNSVQGDKQNYVLDVAQTMAGGWRYPTGYLFETLRGRGLVYVVEDENYPGRSSKLPGDFFVFAGCEPSKVNEVVETCLLNIARLQGSDADMQPDWFRRSKLLITTGDALEQQTAEEQAQTAALDELFGLGYDYHAQFDPAINAVTLEQVRSVAQQRLRECVVTICTPDPASVHVASGERVFHAFPTVDLTPRGVQHDQSVQHP